MATGYKTLGSGRTKGTPNRVMADLKAAIASIIEDPEGLDHLRQHYRRGELPAALVIRFLE